MKTPGLIVAAMLAVPMVMHAQGGGGISPGLVRQADPITAEEVPLRKPPAPLPPRGTYKPPRTPWGDPDISGAYNNSDESGIPFERPDEFTGRRLEDFSRTELAALTR